MAKCLLQKNSYINIQPFMVVNLGLDGVSLIIYALIYGHTVNKGVFYGSLEYMAQWCHCTTRNVTNCINSLVEKGLIRKKKTSKGCFYMAEKVNTDLPEEDEEELENPFEDEFLEEKSSEKKEKSSVGLEKSSCSDGKKFLCDRKKVPVQTEKSSDNILEDNLEDILDNNLDLNSSANSLQNTKNIKSQKKQKPQKHKYGEFQNVLLTDSEKQKLDDELGADKSNAVIKHFSELKEMKGYKYNSDYLAIKKWGIDSFEKQRGGYNPRSQPAKRFDGTDIPDFFEGMDL